jgi:hypothetical protein
MLFLAAILPLSLGGCVVLGDGTTSLTVTLTLDDSFYNMGTVHFIVMPADQYPGFPSGWLATGSFTLTDGYGYGTAFVPDGSGYPTATQALFADGEQVDIYLVLDTDGNFNPFFGYGWSSGDLTGEQYITITAPGDNTVNFFETDLIQRL